MNQQAVPIKRDIMPNSKKLCFQKNSGIILLTVGLWVKITESPIFAFSGN